MTVVSSKEFAINQKKYFDMAVNEDVYIKNGKNMFMFSIANNNEQVCLEPDDDYDLRRAITKDELLKGLHKYIDEMYAKNE